jgi:hypothetical protein
LEKNSIFMAKPSSGTAKPSSARPRKRKVIQRPLADAVHGLADGSARLGVPGKDDPVQGRLVLSADPSPAGGALEVVAARKRRGGTFRHFFEIRIADEIDFAPIDRGGPAKGDAKKKEEYPLFHDAGSRIIPSTFAVTRF